MRVLLQTQDQVLESSRPIAIASACGWCWFAFPKPLTLTLSPEYRGEGTRPVLFCACRLQIAEPILRRSLNPSFQEISFRNCSMTCGTTVIGSSGALYSSAT